MKIYFNRKPVVGPWGGGSKVLFAIVQECVKRGHKVFFEEDIRLRENFDVLLCFDPRQTANVHFQELINYKFSHNSAKLIQRIGDLGTHGKPELLQIVKEASEFSDLLVFPSEWAKSYFGSTSKRTTVILNAPLREFHVKKTIEKLPPKLSIVSHHWSDNSLKGFDVYESLDKYCRVSPEYSFTFIGRKPSNVEISNHIPPMNVEGLIKEIPKHQLYITASKLEAGANHVLEALAMGLPVLYHKDGGSINEYCREFGIAYKDENDLISMLKNEGTTLKSMIGKINYRRSSEDMASEYVDMLEAESK